MQREEVRLMRAVGRRYKNRMYCTTNRGRRDRELREQWGEVKKWRSPVK